MFLEEAVWRPVVERICRATGVDSVKTVEAGYPGTCAVFVVNGARIVKIYPPMLPLDGAKEQQVYRLLDGRVKLLPTLLGAGIYPDRIDWPYLVLEFCPGTPIRELYAGLDAASRAQIAQQLGQTLRTVHATPLGNAPTLDPRPVQWISFLRRRRVDSLNELRAANIFAEPLLNEIARFLKHYTADHINQLLARIVVPVLLHADLTEDHLLLVRSEAAAEPPDPRRAGGHGVSTWRASALLDWADAEVGAPAYEWIPLWFGLCNRDPAFFQAILHHYDPNLALDTSFYRATLAYTFLQRFGAGIIEHVWRRDGCPPITTLDELRAWLWPQSTPL